MLLELPRWSLYKEETISYMALLDTGKIYFIELSMTNSIDATCVYHFKARS